MYVIIIPREDQPAYNENNLHITYIMCGLIDATLPKHANYQHRASVWIALPPREPSLALCCSFVTGGAAGTIIGLMNQPSRDD